MSFLGDIKAKVAGVAAITSIVGTKIYPGMVPTSQDLPYLTYEVVGYEGVHNILSASGIASFSVQFDAIGTQLQVESIAEGLRNALDGFRGIFNNNTTVNYCTLLSQIDNSVLEAKAANQLICYRRTLDFNIGIVQAIPTL